MLTLLVKEESHKVKTGRVQKGGVMITQGVLGEEAGQCRAKDSDQGHQCRDMTNFTEEMILLQGQFFSLLKLVALRFMVISVPTYPIS